MADTKISALTVATTPLAGTEVLPIVQGGVTKQVSVADLTAGRAVSAASLTLTTALTAANGGTGQSSYTVGDLLYASTTTALSKLADVATGNALISGGVGVAPSWGKIGLTTHVSGTLGTGNGGTGLTSFTANGIVYASSTSVLATSALLTWNGGNLCVDATPPAWLWPSGATGIVQLRANGALSAYNAATYLSQNWYYNAGEKFIDNGYAMRYDQTSGKHVWYVSNASNAGGAGAALTWLQVMQTHASGGVSIGNTTDPGAGNLSVTGAGIFKSPSSGTNFQVFSSASSTNAAFYVNGSGTVNGIATGANGAASATYFNKDSGSTRSINAAGTINASGADYAEYETKNDDCGQVAKGQIIGFDQDGKLTDKWAQSKSFAVKTTNPSYVGGDTWGSEEIIGAKPEDLNDKPTQKEIDEYELAMTVWKAKLETARQKVDRIAYAGKVPCNVMGAKVGDYIIAVQNGDAIDGQVVEAPTFDQYRFAVGKVRSILLDGRCEIAVIIH